MIHDVTLRLNPRTAATKMLLLAAISDSLHIDANRIKDMAVTRRSIDARQRNVAVNLNVRVWVDEDRQPEPPQPDPYKNTSAGSPQAIVVGAGPAGLFAALELLKHGIRPIVIERGKKVDDRRRDMALISREGKVDPDSNYCFGEGGAGAFSDGKLFTRSKKRGSVDDVLRTLVAHGADEAILIDTHAHIGSDKLPGVIKRIRETIEAHGGSVVTENRVESLILHNNEVTGVRTASGKEWHGPVILATGHSARDVYRMLHNSGIRLEPKGIAVGCRMEHPQELIDRMRYHSPAGRGKYLPPAEYTLSTRIDGRGVYSFCMCPGGVIIPAASAPGEIVVNGMSASARSSRWANSGMVVEILPEDIPDSINPEAPELKLMSFQETIEKSFFNDSGNGSQNSPAQRMKDFVDGIASKDLPASSYPPGLHPARVDKLLPAGVSRRLREGLRQLGAHNNGFLTNEAVVIGAETRTSSPVRIPRNPESLNHTDIKGLYPAGEGAGYAGGIVSAAMDGEKVARSLAASINASL